MPRTAAKVTLADLNRAVKAASAAPTPMAVEVDADGTIRIVPFTDNMRDNKRQRDRWGLPPEQNEPVL